ncbi:phosphatidylinositide phosphatase SAC2 [Aplysia californica]|uniref:Phosphatidylinositide phosphatase SAC2 n=1 Tax=Aplysia californica TaxID=6500 RepID=A0ABM0K1S9_APLCA|nr:phosphatidylinositide phosphatase SAC2 [Aplysia californica]
MKFENVSILTDGIKDIIKDMRYCWVDNRGVICEQKGVFRVNCVDCLDRTNVVQTAIARIVMETQFRKLGLLPPEESLPPSCRLTYRQIWANNGDVISRQYAGTAALKGDFTRTGERKFSGLMKDGVNSANRYYLRFRDAHRQAAIDLSLGQPVSEALLVPSAETDDVDGNEMAEKEENMKMMIEDCTRMLIVEPEHCLGGWALINADAVEGDSDRQDMDILLLLSQRSVYVAWYSDEEEEVTKYQRIYLEDIDKVEIGMEPAVFKSKFPCLRLFYHYQAEEGLFHMFRTPTLRMFNCKVTTVVSQEEAKESLRMIADAFKSAQEILSINLEVVEKTKLDRKKALPHPDIVNIHQQQQENSLAGIKLPRDVSSEMDSSINEKDEKDLSIADGTGLGRSSRSPMSERRSLNTDHSGSSSRSKSPLGFLSTLPKPALPSFNKANFNPGRFSIPKPNIPKPNLKMNLQNLNLVRRIRSNRGGDNKNDVDDDDSFYNQGFSDGPQISSLQDEVNKEVVFGSCGILATSPKQLIESSRHWNAADGRQRSLDHSNGQLARQASSGDKPDTEVDDHSMFTFDDLDGERPPVSGDRHTVGECDKSQEINGEKVVNSENGVGVEKVKGLTEADLIDFTTDVHVAQEDGRQSKMVKKEEEEDEYCVIENEEVQAILNKCHRLHHPHMKTSLSDTTLSANTGTDASGISQTGASQSRDFGLMSRFKLKMSNLSKPAPAKTPESVISRNLVRKSQRAMEVFEQLMQEKLPSNECRSRFIFI